MAEREEELKGLLMKLKDKNEKAGLKLNIQKTKIMASRPIISWHAAVHGVTKSQTLLKLFSNHAHMH